MKACSGFQVLLVLMIVKDGYSSGNGNSRESTNKKINQTKVGWGVNEGMKLNPETNVIF